MAHEWPETLEPTDMTWGVVYNNRAFTSSLTNWQQIVSQPGAYWLCTLNFGVLYEEDERELTSLLGRLQGMFGTVNVPSITRTRTDNIGAPVVVSAVAQSTLLKLGGMTPGIKVFSRGDHITIGGEMFEVVEHANSDPSGTPLEFISRWAPASENNTLAYAQAIAKRLGVGVRDSIDIFDQRVLREAVVGIIVHENGGNPYKAEVIDEGIRRTLA